MSALTELAIFCEEHPKIREHKRIGKLLNAVAAELEQLRAENVEMRKALVFAVTVLCETRGHAGRRPCQYCYDMQLAAVFAKYPEEEQK